MFHEIDQPAIGGSPHEWKSPFLDNPSIPSGKPTVAIFKMAIEFVDLAIKNDFHNYVGLPNQ